LIDLFFIFKLKKQIDQKDFQVTFLQAEENNIA